ncbi:DUF1554 domain-containing protein [Leptospira borgpetersenii]|uniref:DUF1554 domain-containing protein n=2 Tax=Leptospira borgpetersenii TaxID=174 RepID=UPI00132EEF38|nr:DUF1554 domain-containing protein [Leptospira borgpetersenii]QHH59835.1 DUF1554 domain-containing protein [Leptospira borgpetersenii]
MLESKRKSIIPLIYKGMRILKSSVDRIIASICSQSASSAGWISRSRKPLQKQNRGPRYKKVYSIFFIWITVLLIGCSGENSNPGIGAISMGSIKDSFLNLIHSHSSNQSLIPSSGLYVFVSSYTNNASVPPLSHNGSFGGVAGADAYCNSHIPSSLTGTGSYKAMLVDGTNRIATTVGATSSTGQKDWVFEKNTSYYRADGNLVFTTNDAGLFDFSNGSLTYSFTDVFSIYDFGIWTGLQSNWKTATSTQLCSSASQPWTSGSVANQGKFGYANHKNASSISAGSIPCQWTSTEDPEDPQASVEMGILCVQEKPITLKGKIGFLEDEQCHHSNSYFTIPWKQCHEFKRHFDPVSGAAISSDVPSPGSYRPVPGQVHLNFFNSAQTNPVGCYISNLQSDLDGNVSGQINNCLKSNPAPDKVRITLVLDYKTNLAYNNSIGTIRSLWEKTAISALNYLPYDQSKFFQTLFVDPNTHKDQVEPYFEVVLSLNPYWNATTRTFDLGIVNILNSIPASMTNSLRLTLSNWQGLVELHNRLKNESVDKIQFDMFQNDPTRNCIRCYTVNFISTYGSGGSAGNLYFSAPNGDNLPTIYPVDSSLGHEFGHTVTSTVAPWLLQGVIRNWGGQYIDQNQIYYGQIHNSNQYQDMGTAFGEGIVNSIGRYLISGNQGAWKLGPGIPLYIGTYKDGWKLNPIVDQKYSDFQRFRREMSVRGILENSPDWTSRLQAIQNLNSNFTDHKTNSNNEARYDGFVHYLLQTPPFHIDSYHATDPEVASQLNQIQYRYDQMKLLGEILDGGPANFKWVSYGDVVHPKNSRVSLKDLLVTLGEMHNSSPLPQNGSLGFTDAYLSIKSPFSPQSLGWRLVQKGLISKDEVNNLYRAVGMDQLANICGYPWALPNCQ